MRANIMLIDDNRIDLFVTQKIINKLAPESNIRTFMSGNAAIDFLEKLDLDNNYQASFIPDIILLDIKMPEMNGFQFLSEFNKIQSIKEKQIKIYLLSSSSNIQDIDTAKNENSCGGFISKPLSSKKLKKIFINYRPFLLEYDYQEEEINLNFI